MNVAICTIYSLFLEYLKKIQVISHIIIQKLCKSDWFLSVLEQKGLENNEIYYIEAAE